MRHKDQGGTGLFHDAVRCGEKGVAVDGVQPLGWFVQKKQARALDHGPRQQDKPLLAGGEFAEWLARVSGETEILQPLTGRRLAAG